MIHIKTYSKIFTEIMTKASIVSTIVHVGHVYWGITSFGKKAGTVNPLGWFLQRGAVLVKVSRYESVSLSRSSLWVLVWDFTGCCRLSCGLVKVQLEVSEWTLFAPSIGDVTEDGVTASCQPPLPWKETRKSQNGNISCDWFLRARSDKTLCLYPFYINHWSKIQLKPDWSG